jgi:two-component system NtrC family sensor kinase
VTKVTKIRIFSSLRSKLLFFVFLVAFVPLIIVTVISLRYTEQITKSILYAHLHVITQTKAKAIARWISERTTDVRVIADSRALKSMDASDIEKFLGSMKTHYLDYKRIVLVDSQGKIIADTSDIQENYLNTEWFRKTMEQKEYISDVFWQGNELMFLIAVAIIKDRQPVGVVCEFIGLQYLVNLATDMSLGKSGGSYLVDKNGVIIAHKDKERILKDKIIDLNLLSQFPESESELKIYQNYRGVDVMGVQAWISQQNVGNFRLPQWLLFAEQETGEVFAKISRYKIGIMALFIILSFIIILGGLLISWSIVNPIKKLADATSIIAKGNFDEPLKVDRIDELGVLIASFNDMAQQLRSFYIALEDRINITREELEKTSNDLKRSREILFRSEKLIALGQVSAGMAHEIRTPLTSIKLFIQALRTTFSSDIEALEDFSIIKGEINRMEEIINRFLDFARPAEPEFEILDINQVLSDAISIMRTRMKDKKITIETKYGDNLPSLNGDEKQLKQVFLNMFLNSIEAMPDGGQITIITNMIIVEHKKLLKITIEDTGCGIESESIKYIFDPFFTTKELGTGMGLAIAFTVIEQHAGLIEAESEYSKGAKFMIYLPLRRGDAIG